MNKYTEILSKLRKSMTANEVPANIHHVIERIHQGYTDLDDAIDLLNAYQALKKQIDDEPMVIDDEIRWGLASELFRQLDETELHDLEDGGATRQQRYLDAVRAIENRLVPIVIRADAQAIEFLATLWSNLPPASSKSLASFIARNLREKWPQEPPKMDSKVVALKEDVFDEVLTVMPETTATLYHELMRLHERCGGTIYKEAAETIKDLRRQIFKAESRGAQTDREQGEKGLK